MTLSVPKLRFPTTKPPVALVEKMFDSQNIDFHPLSHVNWSNYPYAPNVRFRIAYNKEELYLQFEVEEETVLATYTDDETSKPWEDSCVEFFWIPTDGECLYYNLEFNAIGTTLFAVGSGRSDRYRFTNEVTAHIRRSSALGRAALGLINGPFKWRITAAIPLSVFSLTAFAPLEGRAVKANFYKCGDNLPVPHFLSWSPIGTEQPDFHRPEFFGTIVFE
jgi:hypothetical protein